MGGWVGSGPDHFPYFKNIIAKYIFLTKYFWQKYFLGGKGVHFPSHTHTLLSTAPPTYNSPSYLLFEVEGGTKQTKQTYGQDAHTYCLFYCIRFRENSFGESIAKIFLTKIFLAKIFLAKIFSAKFFLAKIFSAKIFFSYPSTI